MSRVPLEVGEVDLTHGVVREEFPVRRLAPGTRLGPYEVLRPLGSGGEGEVHEARMHLATGGTRPVALKVVPEAGRLRREAAIAGRLRHPHLVDVLDVRTLGAWTVCAMELCDGSLAAHVPLPPAAVVDVGLQVAAALEYGSAELGLVHLDLKPDNLLHRRGVVKVADLGVSRAEGFDRAPIAGTPGFAAPEQLRGGPVDARSDVFALGRTLLALATGSLPPAGHTWDSGGDAAPPADAEAPRWLAELLLRATAPDPADRFPTMAGFAEALRALRADGRRLAEVLPRSTRDPDDAFVGRAGALDALEARLTFPGRLALKGPAGVGKSRLAREAAVRWGSQHGAVVSVHGGGELAHTVAAALELPLRQTEPADGVVGRALAARGPLLLVVDDASAADAVTAAAWCTAAPVLRVLLTARDDLTAPSLEVEPLTPPEARSLLRLRAADRGVTPSDAVADALVDRLDGLPLAVELAAGRMGVWSADEVLARLDLSLLRDGRPDRPASLRDALEASWRTLDAGAQDALARLSVFEQDATLADLQGVGLGDETVRSLLGRSLARRTPEDRVELPQLVRTFAAEQLDLLGIRRSAEEAHGRLLAGRWSSDVLQALDRPGGAAGRRALTREIREVVVACRRAVARGDAVVAATLGRALFAHGSRRGPLSSLEAWLAGTGLEAELETPLLQLLGQPAAAFEAARRAVAHSATPDRWIALAGASLGVGRLSEAAEAAHRVGTSGPTAAQAARAHSFLAQVHQRRGELARAGEALDHALEAATASGITHSVTLVRLNRAGLAVAMGQRDVVVREATLALEGAAETGDELGEVQAWLLLAEGLPVADRAGPLQRALDRGRAIGDARTTAVASVRLAEVEREVGSADRALAHLDAALALQVNRWDTAATEAARGELLLQLGRPEEAAAALAAAALARRADEPVHPRERALAVAARALAGLGRGTDADALAPDGVSADPRGAPEGSTDG